MFEIGNWMKRRTKGGRAAVAMIARRVVVEALEGRTLLSGTVPAIAAGHRPPAHDVGVAYPMSQVEGLASGGAVSPGTTNNPGPVTGALTPSQLRQAYGFGNILLPDGSVGTGAGMTIGIVDAYHDPYIQSDLHTFDVQYMGGVDPNFTQVNLGTATNFDAAGRWELEEALDVEWAHAMAPQANIILVEAASSSDMLPAVDKAVAMGAQVISLSWGMSDNSTETAYDSHYAVPNVTFVACSGDNGAPPWYPASCPTVLGVGGTALALNPNNNWSSEAGWYNGGAGISGYESRPSYQPTTYTNGSTSGVALTKRGVPDVAYDASATSGVSVYTSFPWVNSTRYTDSITGWARVSGTSVGTPQWAALVAIADQGRAQVGLASLASTDTLATLYANPGDFHDITTGTTVGSPTYSAGTGYDLVTGLGSPQSPLVVSSLIGVSPTATPAAPTGLSATPGDRKVSLTWDATSGTSGWNVYRSTDGINYSLDATVSGTSFLDGGLTNGVSYFYQVTALNSLGESAASSPAAASPQIPPAAPTSLSTSGGYALTGNATCYALTVRWGATFGASSYNILRSSTSGSGYAVIASGVSGTSYTDPTVAAGTTYYYVLQAVSAGGAISVNSTQVAGTALPAAPTNLTATSGNMQIALAWSASTGATSYNVLRSTTNGSGYVLIASGVTGTSYIDSKLTAGVTYYYVIQAVDSSGASLNSAQVSATAKHGK